MFQIPCEQILVRAEGGEGIYTVATRTNFAGKRMDSQTKETEMSINTSSELRKIATNKRDTTKAHRPSQLVTD